MPEIKTRQRKNQPVMNTAQRQMQRNFVRSKAEQAAHRQSEQSDSPSNDAEEKVSRTAEDAVRDGASLAVREIRSLHQRNNDKHGISSEADMPEEYQKTPAKWPSRSRPATQQEAGRKAAVQRIVQQQQANATGGVPKSSDALSHRTAQKPIRTREQSIAVPAQTAQQEAARKAAVQNIVRQRQTQKQDALQIERAHFSQQVEASTINPAAMPLPDEQAIPMPIGQSRNSGIRAATVDGFHNTDSKRLIPIKKKSDLPIRTKQGAVPIKTAERASEKIVDATAEKAFREAQKATITAAQKSSHAAATAGRRAMVAAKKAAELTAKLARSAAEAAKALYTAIAAGGVASILVIVIVVLIGCGAAIFGSQDESTETLPLSAEVEAYEPVIRKYAKQYGIPDYVLLIQAVMMQESGGRGNDPMQASECGYNTQYPRTPGGITDPEYSISVGIHNLADCLQTAGAESPIDLDHIQLALQGYNFGSG